MGKRNASKKQKKQKNNAFASLPEFKKNGLMINCGVNTKIAIAIKKLFLVFIFNKLKHSP